MSTSLLLQPPSSTNPETAVRISQSAATFFATQSRWSLASLPYPLSLLSNTESQEKWASYENVFLACLRTGDTESARLCLEQLTARFGTQNERIMALRGLFQEAMAQNDGDLAEAMNGYETILTEDPSNFAIRKRRVALLRCQGKVDAAATALISLLDTSPTDAEAWSELGDVYLTQGLYEQAVYCLEEVILAMPNAWNIHARIGEVLYLFAASMPAGGDQLKRLSESMRRFCRSVELCDDYLRGYYGLKLVS